MGAFSFDTNIHLTQTAQYKLYGLQIGAGMLIFYLILIDLERLGSAL